MKPDDRFNMERFSVDNYDDNCGLEVDLDDSDKESEIVPVDLQDTPKTLADSKLQLEAKSTKQDFDDDDVETNPIVSKFQIPDPADDPMLSSRTV